MAECYETWSNTPVHHSSEPGIDKRTTYLLGIQAYQTIERGGTIKHYGRNLNRCLTSAAIPCIYMPCVSFTNLPSLSIDSAFEMPSITAMASSIDEKKTATAGDVELVPSQKEGEIVSESEYTPEQYQTVLRKVDRYLLPLMWFC